MPTIVEVAKKAGVAVSTVSYALSGKRPVSEATQKRIQAAIEELGYHPNYLARSLASKRTRTIALLFPSVLNSRVLSDVQFEFVAGVANVASQHGYGLLLWTVPDEELLIEQLIQEKRAEGVILMEVKLEDARVEMLRKHQFPFSLIGHNIDHRGVSFVDFDFSEGLQLAVNHLAQLGHHHIAFVNLDQKILHAGYGPAVRSQLGFEKALAETGLEGVMSSTASTPTAAAETLSHLLAHHPEITAVIAQNEIIAAGFTRLVYETGIRIPDDLSVIVIASNAVAERMTPPMTNIELPAEEMGRVGAGLLIDQLEGVVSRYKNLLLPPKLNVRQSTESYGIRQIPSAPVVD